MADILQTEFQMNCWISVRLISRVQLAWNDILFKNILMSYGPVGDELLHEIMKTRLVEAYMHYLVPER